METVSFFTFLEEKITEILFQLFFLALVAFLLIFYGVDTLFVVLLVILFISIQGLFQWCLYRKKRKASQHIIDLVDGLEETYYIADVLPKPKEFQNEAYYYALKKACKSMNDEIGKITEEKQDYQEYVESFAHEIKIPIGALSLTFDNTKNYTLKKETDKIFQLVEQMLYYARSENTEKDYFVKQLQLDEVIHNVILKFRHSLMETSVYKGYKQDKIEMRGDRAEMSDFPLYLNTVAGGLDCRDQTIGGFSSVVKIYAVPVVEIIG